MDLLEFLVIAITALAACLQQAWISLQPRRGAQSGTAGLPPPRRPLPGALPQPANDTWTVRRAA